MLCLKLLVNIACPFRPLRLATFIPPVKAVIVGSRLNDQTAVYAQKNLLAFSFMLDDEIES
jgi:hypothetical protein